MQNRGIILVVVLFFLVILAIVFTPSPTNWDYTFSKYHKIPHGSYIIFDQLDELFPDTKIEVSDSSVFTTLSKWDNPNTAYILITDYLSQYSSKSINWNKLDTFTMNGGTVFCSARHIYATDNFLTKGGTISSNEYSVNGDTSIFSKSKSEDVHLTLNQIDSTKQTKFTTKSPYANRSLLVDSLKHERLGAIHDTITNFIRVPNGKGAFYFHSNPEVFTNNAILRDSLQNYASGLLTHINHDIEYIIWDEYYKPTLSFLGESLQTERKSPLFLFEENRPLKIAKWLLIVGSILLIFTRFQRYQQAVPVLNPPRNKTVDFVKNMGKLYFEKKEHFDIAQKKINYFEVGLRNQYKLEPLDQYEKKINQLADLTGFKEEDLKHYYTKRSLITKVSQLSEEQLISISKSIEKLKKNQQ